MKLVTKLVLAAALTSSVSFGSVSFSGSALRNATGLAAGDFGVILVDATGAGYNTISLVEGESLTSSASYGPGFQVVGSATSATSFGATTFNGSANFELINGITQNDTFAVLVFSTSLAAGGAVLNDTYRIWTNPAWIVPADGSAFTYTTGTVNPAAQFPTLTSTPTITGTVGPASVIPEPSSFSAVAGLMAVGFAASRRRRS